MSCPPLTLFNQFKDDKEVFGVEGQDAPLHAKASRNSEDLNPALQDIQQTVEMEIIEEHVGRGDYPP
jgi:hypothetical protein